MNIRDGLLYKAIFGTNLTATDLAFKGAYDAGGNVAPTPATLGDYYVISNGGTFDGSTYNPNDFTWFNGTTWNRTPSLSTGVTLVNGQTGNVILDTDDITEGNNKYVTAIDLIKLSNLPSDTLTELADKYSLTGNNTDDLIEGLNNLFLTTTERAKLVNVPVDTNTELSDKISRTTDTLDDILNGVNFVKSENNFTDAYKDKLNNLTDNYKGSYIDDSALKTAYPTGDEGDYATVQSTGTIWIWSISSGDWVDTLSGSVGDMLQVTYDPSSKAVDVYDMDNMDDGTTNVAMTVAERNKLSGLDTGDKLTVTAVEKDDIATISGKVTAEQAQDSVGLILTDTNTVDLNYDDVTPEILADIKYQNSTTTTLSEDTNGLQVDVNDNSSTQKVELSKAGTITGNRKEINFVEGNNVTLTLTDNAVEDRVDIEIASTAVAGSIATQKDDVNVVDSTTELNFEGAVTVVSDGENKATITVGSGSDELAKVSLNDTTSGYLEDKIVESTGKTTVTTLNEGTNEALQVGIGADIFDKTTDTMDNVLDGSTYVKTTNDYTNAEKQKLSDMSGSFGVISLPTLTKNVDGTLDIGTDGIISFNTQSDGLGDIIKLNCTTGASNLSLIDETVNYVYANYNAGSPIYEVTTNQNLFFTDATLAPVVRVTREDTNLHFEEYDEYGIMLSNKSLFKDIALNGFQRQSGLILSTSPTRVATVGSGVAWFGVENWNIGEVVSGSVGNMYEYYLVAGVWNKSANLSLYDNLYYSDGTDRLTLDNNKYVAKYFYRDIGDDLEIYYTHGNQYNAISEAVNEAVPMPPAVVSSHSIYVGKIVIQKNEEDGEAYPRVWSTCYINTGAVNHDDLANIDLVGTGVTNGHLSDQAETIYGKKTINDDLALDGLTEKNVIDSTSLNASLENIDNTFTITKEPTGFYEPENAIVTYDSTTRTITLTGTVEAYYRGKIVSAIVNGYTSPAHSATLDTSYLLVYDGDSIKWISPLAIDFSYLLIAYVYYGTLDKWAIRECHGLMQWQSHKENHYNIGTYRLGGGTIGDFTLNSSTLAHRRPSVSSTILMDEDLQTINPPLPSSGNYTTYSITGEDGADFDTTSQEIVPLITGVPAWNSFNGTNWVQSSLPNNNYMAIWLVAIPVSSDTESQKYRYVWQQGQYISTNIEDVKSRTPLQVERGSLDLLTPESIYIGKIIIRYSGGNWILSSVENLTGNKLSQVASPSGLYLSTVSTDGTLSGVGTIDTPLGIETTLGINVGGTLSNVSYLDQENTYTENQTAPTFTGDLIGNSDTSTTLETARNIAGESFDGSADIDISMDNILEGSTYVKTENNYTDIDKAKVDEIQAKFTDTIGIETKVIGSFAHATYKGATVNYNVTDGTNSRTGQLYIVTDGTNANITDTSVDLGDSSPISFDVGVNGTDLEISATSTTETWTINYKINLL